MRQRHILNPKIKTIYYCMLNNQSLHISTYYLKELISNVYMNKLLKNQWCLYILETSDSSLYTGITNNLSKRIKTHRAGKGSKYVRSRLPFSVIYIELLSNRAEASKLEYKVKKLKRINKLKLKTIKKENTKIFLCTMCNLYCRIDINMGQIGCPVCKSSHYVRS